MWLRVFARRDTWHEEVTREEDGRNVRAPETDERRDSKVQHEPAATESADIDILYCLGLESSEGDKVYVG